MTFDPKAWLWFLSSYSPLWVMLGLRFDPCWLRIGLIAFGIVCGAYVAFVLTRSAGERPSNTALTITGDAGADVSGYLAAYLLPFLTVADPSATDLVAYAIFVAVAGLVYVRSGLMQINPTVYLMSRKVLRATIPVRGTTKEVFVISRRDLRVASTLNAERFSDRVYIDQATER
ncbi:MAG: hypothetical protein ACR2MA_13350 [Egibacteraceae bacterium]|jgi:hypothetical protein